MRQSMGGVPRFVRLSTSDNILSCKMATSGDWKTAENDQIPPNMGVFFNRNDAQRPEIVAKCQFETQDGDFRFLKNSGE